MDHSFTSGSLRLVAHLARPPFVPSRPPGLVLCHGYPAGVAGGAGSANTFPELADRIATEVGWVVLTFNFRGAGGSEGDFSLGGWDEDLHAAIDHLHSTGGVDGVWLAGFGTGGGLAVCAGSTAPDVRGVAALAAPADFDDWADHPRRLLQHSRELGLIKDRTFPRSFDAWVGELRRLRPFECARDLAPRPLLIVHGADDESVPHFDGRVVADAHGSAEVRIVAGAGHRLRHDPRAVAILLGWLDRQKHQAPA